MFLPKILRARYKENGGNAAFLTTDCPDFLANCRGSRVGCLNQMRAIRPPLQLHYFSATGCFSSQSFWKAGSPRKGSQNGSSLRSAGVMGVGPWSQPAAL